MLLRYCLYYCSIQILNDNQIDIGIQNIEICINDKVILPTQQKIESVDSITSIQVNRRSSSLTTLMKSRQLNEESVILEIHYPGCEFELAEFSMKYTSLGFSQLIISVIPRTLPYLDCILTLLSIQNYPSLSHLILISSHNHGFS